MIIATVINGRSGELVGRVHNGEQTGKIVFLPKGHAYKSGDFMVIKKFVDKGKYIIAQVAYVAKPEKRLFCNNGDFFRNFAIEGVETDIIKREHLASTSSIIYLLEQAIKKNPDRSVESVWEDIQSSSSDGVCEVLDFMKPILKEQLYIRAERKALKELESRAFRAKALEIFENAIKEAVNQEQVIPDFLLEQLKASAVGSYIERTNLFEVWLDNLSFSMTIQKGSYRFELRDHLPILMLADKIEEVEIDERDHHKIAITLIGGLKLKINEAETIYKLARHTRHPVLVSVALDISNSRKQVLMESENYKLYQGYKSGNPKVAHNSSYKTRNEYISESADGYRPSGYLKTTGLIHTFHTTFSDGMEDFELFENEAPEDFVAYRLNSLKGAVIRRAKELLLFDMSPEEFADTIF
ncbi:hypothetical protein [Paenibacillus polymyxa]|uniref:TRAM domain-containing protein n=1 Tax=Paenibacillus polymyxa (strain SC2) TaxID=886882 RepID=E3EJN3_PAEPS|nr:hypothetical protein [Paenibacillus polymyxa]ADO59404.1 hypothetical protein PPSC2_28035 [Paenibacillus polymyxa SC2]WPQ59754.1 hypothetical protein SKN87_26050 [Paenibacillus polymyxa]